MTVFGSVKISIQSENFLMGSFIRMGLNRTLSRP